MTSWWHQHDIIALRKMVASLSDREASWRPLTEQEFSLFQSGAWADLHGLWSSEGCPARYDSEEG